MNQQNVSTEQTRLQALSTERIVHSWTVVVKRPKGKEQSFQLVGDTALRCGSNSGNDIVIENPTVSRLHAELTAEQAGVRVRDLGSTNGTFVGRMEIHNAVVPPGMSFLIGDTEISIQSPEKKRAIQKLRDATSFGPLVGASDSMRALFERLAQISPSNATVLINGETGTGKELVARAIHENSSRKSGPFVVFDCASVSPTLIESELFGHERGSFTGADMRRIGCFEEADGGTLFIDEIGELPLEQQPKLLRVLERHEVRRVGSSKSVNVDVRVVAATHRDLGKQVNAGTMREDLYFRLAVLRVAIPSLRERAADIPALVKHLLEQILNGDVSRAGAFFQTVSDEQWEQLSHYPWPGNVRELRNVIERSLALGGDKGLMLAPSATSVPAVRPSSPTLETGASAVSLEKGFHEQKQHVIERFEETYVEAMLKKHNGNFSRAAANAGIDRMYFKRLLKKYSVPKL